MDTKFQKKFESDMTRKEKRELEREKLASMNGKAKLEYILNYYKFHILSVILVILLIFGIVKWADSLKDETMLYVGAINAVSDGEGMMEDFQKRMKDTDEHHKYQLDTSIFFSKEGGGQADYSSQMKMVTLVGAGTVDIYIGPKDTYDQYRKEEGVLVSVEELMGEKFVREHADICEDAAIRVEDSKTLQKYGVVGSEPAYLMVFAYAKHPEVAKEFVEFAIE